MILRFLPSGVSNGDAPIRYLLGKKDLNGAERNPPPVVVYGDPEVTKALIDTCPRKYKYTSAVIAFRDNEHPSNEDLGNIIHDLRQTLAPGMGPSRINMLAVLHRDKGNTEIHIIFPMMDLKTGKQYNVMPPGKAGKQLASDWQASWNHKLGYDQVVANPLKTYFSSLDLKLAKFAKPTDLMHKRLRVKSRISELVSEKIQSGQFKDRDDLIKFFQEAGMTITRKGKDYISVRGADPNLKAIRLKGEAFSEGVNYSDLMKKVEENASSGAKLSPTDAFLVELRLKRAVVDRESFIQKRDAQKPLARTYTLPGHPQPVKIPRVKVPTRREKLQQGLVNLQSRLSDLRAQEKESASQTEDLTLKANVVRPDLNKAPKKENSSPSISSSGGGAVPSSDLDTSIGHIEFEIRGAIAIISGAGGAKEKAEATKRLYALKQRLFDLQERKRLEKVREMNYPKPIPGFI